VIIACIVTRTAKIVIAVFYGICRFSTKMMLQ
jgi:hypothetical protein